MNGASCRIRNLQRNSLSGFRLEKDALAAGGHYLNPDSDGWLDAGGKSGLCIVCENCGSVVEDSDGSEELFCPDCGETTFRVIQTFRLTPIGSDFVAHWTGPGLKIAIDIPDSARSDLIGIRYTVDGSDPILTSPSYTEPIPYRKSFAPIRAAVFYSNARSEVIEWDYGRAEKNRKRIQDQSFGDDAPDSFDRKSKEPSAPKTTEASPSEKKKDENKGGGCIVILGMVIGGIALICNDWAITGWILTVLGVLAAFGMSQDNKS